MEANKMIRDLRNVEQKNKDKHVFTGEINISIMARDTANLIEAQQQEIEQLKEVNRQLMWENISDNMSENLIAEQEEQIESLTADKDEQAGQIMRLEELAKDLYFAYINKDEDFPHSFETQAIEKYQAYIGAIKGMDHDDLALCQVLGKEIEKAV